MVNPTYSCGGLSYEHSYGNEQCEAKCATTPPIIPPPKVCEDVQTPFTVTVIDKDTKDPIPDASVTITSVDLPDTTKVVDLTTGDFGEDEAGKCTAHIPEGANYTIKVEHPDYEWKSTNIENPLQEYPCDAKLATTIELSYRPTCEGPFMAEAVDANSGEIVPGADLTITVTLDEKSCEREKDLRDDENYDCTEDIVEVGHIKY